MCHKRTTICDNTQALRTQLSVLQESLKGQITFCVRGVVTLPCGVPLVRSTNVPPSSCAGVFNQRSIYSTTHCSCACFFTAFISSSQSRLSKKPRTSRSNTQSYFQQFRRACPTAS